MARGDAWRISGGIYIPNSRFQIDSDYDWTASENIPDAWTKTITSGTCTTNLAQGFDSGWCLRIANNASGDNFITSGRSPAGSVPQRAKTAGLNVRIRVVFWYKKSVSTQALTPILTLYNADESLSQSIPFTAVTTAAASWTQYDQSEVVALNQVSLGFYPDHCALTFQVGGAAVPVQYHLAGLTVSYRLTDIDNATPYDTLTSWPIPSGLRYTPISMGRYERTHLGQMRRIDATGGIRTHRLSGTFEIARDADAKLFSLARALCEGDYTVPDDTANPVPKLAMSPLVIEPFIGDGATQSAGKVPENFYAWMTEPPDLQPVGYLGNVWSGTIGFEEVG